MVLAGTIVYVVRINWLSRKIDVKPNSPLIDMEARKQFTKGFTRGIVKTMIPRKNGTFFFEIYPIDIEQGENAKPVELLTLVVAKQYLRGVSQVEGSSRRQIIKVLYRNKSEMPENMRETLEGQFLEAEGQKAWLEQTFGKMIRSGDEAIAEAMRLYSRGNIARATMATAREQIAEARKIFSQEQNEDDNK